MSRPRRRTSAGISLGVIIAMFVAVFGSRAQRGAEAVTPSRASAPAEARDTRDQPITTAAPSAATGRSSPRSPGFTSRRSLEEHFEKHGAEFPGLDMAAYLAAAQTLRDAPVGGDVVEVRRADGVVTRFDRTTGAFLAVNRDGTIRTFFRPNDGEAYFRRQATRAPDGGP